MTDVTREPPIVVVALGGHAFMAAGEPAKVEVYERRAAEIGDHLMTLIDRNYNLVITHGNGPQVGNLVLKNEASKDEFEPDPLDVLVAQTQGSLGYIMQQALLNKLRRMELRRYVVTFVTQVLVNANDPAFQDPTKPIGPFYDEEYAKRMAQDKGWKIVHQPKRGWRRVVPSPQPLRVVQWDTIRLTAKQGHIVIACGGGGIPITRSPEDDFVGVEAVVDKDLSSAVLATQIGAELFIVLSDVPEVYINYNQPGQQPLAALTINQTERYMEEGQFPPGSMGPKIQAILQFLKAGGKRGLITTPDCLEDALDGRSGTHFVGRI
jgi:carbamate kinase